MALWNNKDKKKPEPPPPGGGMWNRKSGTGTIKAGLSAEEPEPSKDVVPGTYAPGGEPQKAPPKEPEPKPEPTQGMPSGSITEYEGGEATGPSKGGMSKEAEWMLNQTKGSMTGETPGTGSIEEEKQAGMKALEADKAKGLESLQTQLDNMGIGASGMAGVGTEGYTSAADLGKAQFSADLAAKKAGLEADWAGKKLDVGQQLTLGLLSEADKAKVYDLEYEKFKASADADMQTTVNDIYEQAQLDYDSSDWPDELEAKWGTAPQNVVQDAVENNILNWSEAVNAYKDWVNNYYAVIMSGPGTKAQKDAALQKAYAEWADSYGLPTAEPKGKQVGKTYEKSQENEPEMFSQEMPSPELAKYGVGGL